MQSSGTVCKVTVGRAAKGMYRGHQLTQYALKAESFFADESALGMESALTSWTSVTCLSSGDEIWALESSSLAGSDVWSGVAMTRARNTRPAKDVCRRGRSRTRLWI
jgi:hypothetical protein